jgi:hypothetical protein
MNTTVTGRDVRQSGRSSPTLRRNISPPSSGTQSKQAHTFYPRCCFLASSAFKFWRSWHFIPPKRRYTSTRLYGVTSQTTVLLSLYSTLLASFLAIMIKRFYLVKTGFFLDTASSSLLDRNQRFGGICCFSLQNITTNHKNRESECELDSSGSG